MDEKMTFPKGTYIFLWGGLVKNAGGMTRAMLKRAELMISESINVKILLCARGMEQLDGVAHYNENGFSLIKESNFIVMENYLGTICSDSAQIHDLEFDENFNEYLYKEEGEDRIYYKNGVPYCKEYKTETSRKRLVTILDAEEHKKMDLIYWDNVLTRIVEYRENSDLKVTRFFSKTKFCFLRIVESKIQKGYKVERIILLNENSRKIKEFNTLNELSQLFFADYVNAIDDSEIFIFHDPFLDFDPGFTKMYNFEKHIYRIGINHGCGFGDERQWYSKVNPRIRDMIESKISPDVEAFICLTCQAVSDFQMRLGKRNIIYQIPNTVFVPETIEPFENRDRYKVIFVGRLAKEKQVDHILKAWKIVEKLVPKAHLHLYGKGELEQEISEQIIIEELERVTIEGFSNSVDREYQKASLSIICSDFEGFSLALHESLANGCPVVSYDFKYGPRDTIINDKNGYICEKNNYEELADCIMKYLRLDEVTRKEMSDNARTSVAIYKENNYKRNWIAMLNEVVNRYPGNLRIYKCEMNVISYSVDVINSKITYNCRLKLYGDIPQIAYGKEKIYIRLYTDELHDFSEMDVNSRADYEKQIFEITFSVGLHEKIALCILWNNSFYEKLISDIL